MSSEASGLHSSLKQSSRFIGTLASNSKILNQTLTTIMDTNYIVECSLKNTGKQIILFR